MSSSKSPKKKSNKTAEKNASAGVSTSAKAAVPEPEWDNESSNKLLNRIGEGINRPDTLKYTSQLEKLSWEKVSFPPYTAEQCKQRWIRLSKEIRKFRTLSELVVDAKDYLKDPYKGQIKKHPDYPKRPLTPYFRFFMEKRDSYAKKHSNLTNLEVTADLSKKYRELPAKKKEKYIEQWQKQHQEFLKAMQKFKEEHPNYFQEIHKPPSEPRTPAAIMKDDTIADFMNQNPNMTKKEATEEIKKRYKSLADDEKQIYIAKALDEHEVYKKEMEIFQKKNPNYIRKNQKQVLTKYEKKLNDRKLGKPEKPPSNGYNLFCCETMPNLKAMLSQKRIVECGRLWNLLDKNKKDAYHSRFLGLKKKYEKDYAVYLKSLTPQERAEEERKNKAKKNARSLPLPSYVVLKPEKEEKHSNKDDDESSGDDDSADDSDGSGSEMSDNDSSDDDESTNADGMNVGDVADSNGNKVAIPPRPTTPISALFLYQKAHRKKSQQQYSWMTRDEITKLLARRFQELPRHKRAKYLRKEEELKAIYNAKLQQYFRNSRNIPQASNGGGGEVVASSGDATVMETTLSPPEQPQAVTGEQLYHEKIYPQYRKKYEGDEKAIEHALHLAWNKLNKVRREPFITKAQKENEENIMAYSEAKRKYDQEMMKIEAARAKKSSASRVQSTSNQINQQNNPTRPAIIPHPPTIPRAKKIKFDGQPKKPPTNGYQLFNSMQMVKMTHLSHSEKFKEIGRLWSSMEPEKKEGFSKEVQKQNDKYRKEMESWLKTLTPDQLIEFEAQQKSKKRKKAGSMAVDGTAAKKAKTTKSNQQPESSTAEADVVVASSSASASVNLKDIKEEQPEGSKKQKDEDGSSEDSSSDDDSDDDDSDSSSSSSDDDSDDENDDDSSSSDSSDDDDEEDDDDDGESGSSSSSSSDSSSADDSSSDE